MHTLKYSQASSIPLSGSYLDPILIAVSCDLSEYISKPQRDNQERLLAKLYSDNDLYTALNSISFGKANPKSRQVLALVTEGIERRIYTRADLLAAVLSFDTIRLQSTLQKISIGDYDPKNPDIRKRLKEGLKRELINIRELEIATHKYNEVKSKR